MEYINVIIFVIGLLFFSYALYFLFSRWTVDRPNGEATRTKYILIWLLTGFLITIFMNTFRLAWFSSFTDSIIYPSQNIISFFVYFFFITLFSSLIFIFVYSRFQNIVRRKVAPFVWLMSFALGANAIRNIPSQSYIENRLLDYGVIFNSDYESFYDITVGAIIVSQILILMIILIWIRANPGFVPPEPETQNTANQSTEPELPKLNRNKDAVLSTDAPKISNESLEKGKKETTVTPIISKVAVLDEEQQSTDQQDIEDTSHNDNSVEDDPATSSSSAPPNPEFLKDEIYAASKFGDAAELIRLLRADGFEIKKNSGKYSLKSQDGSETIASNDSELINFGKRYARS